MGFLSEVLAVDELDSAAGADRPVAQFARPKSTLRQIAAWFDGGNTGGDDAWRFVGDGIDLTNAPIYNLWQDWRRGHNPRPGGYLDQPLELLALMESIDLIAATITAKNTKNFDWSKFSPLQMELIGWIENNGESN